MSDDTDTGAQPSRATPEIRVMPLSAMRAADYNPRQISDHALAGLTASIRRWGLVEPIVWNSRTGNIVGGHQRYKVLIDDGVIESPVVVVDLDPIEEKALNVSLNNPKIAGEFTAGLADILEELQVEIPDMEFESLCLEDLVVEIPIPDPDPPKPHELASDRRVEILCSEPAFLSIEAMLGEIAKIPGVSAVNVA